MVPTQMEWIDYLTASFASPFHNKMRPRIFVIFIGVVVIVVVLLALLPKKKQHDIVEVDAVGTR